MRFFRAYSLPLAAMLLFACGVRSKRDFNVPAKEITYGDACNLQSYFDERAGAGLAPLTAADETIARNDKGQTIGEGTYALKDAVARRRFARLVRDEYAGLDDKLLQGLDSTEGDIRVHIKWWDAGPIHRVRPDDDIVVTTSTGEAELPPNVCVSDFLFGDKVYAMRARYLKSEVEMATGKPIDVPAPSEPPPVPSSTPAP